MSSTTITRYQQLQDAPRLNPALWVLMTILLALCGFFASTANAQDQTNILEAVDIRTLPGNRTQLRFQFSQSPQTPRSFTINEPARIVLDFVGVKNGLNTRRQAINVGAAESLTVLEGGDRTRASLNLARMVPYSVRTEGGNVLLTLDAGSTSAATDVPELALAGRQIGSIDFRRGVEGEAIISVKMSSSSIPVDVRQEGTRIVADFLNASVPRGQERRLDVTDFATPVTLIDVINRGKDARISVQPTGQFEYLAYQADDIYTIEVRPVVEEEPPTVEDPLQRKFTGELLSLNFQDIEVRSVLQILADFTGLNIVVSDSVQGNLTLRLQNVPWDQALAIILRTKGLTMRQNGNVIYVAPTEEVAARDKLELEARKQVQELAPLRTELVQINYAKAADLAELIKTKSSQGGDSDQETSILSERGNVTVDVRTNTLIVQDVAERISEIRDLVSRLDKPVRQVMIDSRLVVANDDFRRDLGVRYGFAGVDRNGDAGLLSLTSSAEGNDAVVNSAISNLTTTGQPFPVATPSLNDRLGVNLGVGAATTRLALAILGRDYLVDLELSALQAEGRGEVLSNPRVVTTDRKQAVIKQGREIPFQTVSQEGTKTEFKEAVLELTVTPQITPDDRIIMDLKVKQDELGQEVPSGLSGGTLPTIDKREVNTQVLVDDGETIVLGGVFVQTITRNVDKVPLLGDIPAVGRLFQRRSKSDSKRELLIFVTPQIVTGEGLAKSGSF